MVLEVTGVNVMHLFDVSRQLEPASIAAARGVHAINYAAWCAVVHRRSQ